ncbi:MAG: beta-propeller fold lactonase family protein, partial [Saprospiraceae bacterium]|nr:beta-propeller fold lactonase family protein [Saprospiraceae bacterium]
MHRLKFSLAVLIICYQQLFAQNTDRLFFKEYYSDNQAQGMTTIDGINFIWTADISADGKHVYTCGGVANVASGGEDDNAIAVFVRNQTTGELTFVQVLFDNQDSGIADGLFSCRDVKVSPDGKHVYSAGSGDHTLGIFSRNSMSGQLTYLSSIKDGVGGVDGLAGLQSLAFNTSGTRLLAVGRTDDAIVLFTRDPVTGSLTFEDMKKNGLAGVTGLDRPISVSVSPDGKHVYTASGSNVNFSGSDALTVFSINESTDNLNFVASYFEGQSQGMQTIDGLDQVTAVK